MVWYSSVLVMFHILTVVWFLGFLHILCASRFLTSVTIFYLWRKFFFIFYLLVHPSNWLLVVLAGGYRCRLILMVIHITIIKAWLLVNDQLIGHHESEQPGVCWTPLESFHPPCRSATKTAGMLNIISQQLSLAIAILTALSPGFGTPSITISVNKKQDWLPLLNSCCPWM